MSYITTTKIHSTGSEVNVIEALPASFTGSGNRVIDIVPQSTIGNGTHFTGIRISGSRLDPQGANCNIRGVAINFDGVDLSNDPDIQGLRVRMPNAYSGEEEHCAVHVQGNSKKVEMIDVLDNALYLEGQLHQDFIATASIPGDTYTVKDVVCNISDSTGGHVHALDVAVAGSSSIKVHAIGTHDNVGVIDQHIGTTATLLKVFEEYTSSYNDITNNCTSSDVNTVIFTNDDEALLFGSADEFDQIDFDLNIPSSHTIIPSFEYSTGSAGAWQLFSPGDDTNGLVRDGIVRWNSGDLSGWATQSENSQDAYYIKITRTRDILPTAPVEETIHINKEGTYGNYEWNEHGNVYINSLRTDIDNSNTDNPPTLDQLNTAFGSAASVGAGFMKFLDDASGGANFYLCTSDGTNWWIFTGAKAAN